MLKSLNTIKYRLNPADVAYQVLSIIQWSSMGPDNVYDYLDY